MSQNQGQSLRSRRRAAAATSTKDPVLRVENDLIELTKVYHAFHKIATALNAALVQKLPGATQKAQVFYKIQLNQVEAILKEMSVLYPKIQESLTDIWKMKDGLAAAERAERFMRVMASLEDIGAGLGKVEGSLKHMNDGIGDIPQALSAEDVPTPTTTEAALAMFSLPNQDMDRVEFPVLGDDEDDEKKLPTAEEIKQLAADGMIPAWMMEPNNLEQLSPNTIVSESLKATPTEENTSKSAMTENENFIQALDAFPKL